LGSCERGNECSVFIKCGEFLEYLRICYLLRKVSASWNQLKSFHQDSILIFKLILLLPGRLTGEAWEPADQAVLFVVSGNTGQRSALTQISSHASGSFNIVVSTKPLFCRNDDLCLPFKKKMSCFFPASSNFQRARACVRMLVQENRQYQILLDKSSSTDGHLSIFVLTGEM
jgi:hypothetical protein